MNQWEEDERANDQRHWRNGVVVLVAVAVIVAVVLWLKPGKAPTAEPTVAPITGCVTTINGRSGTVTLKPGDALSVVVNCTGKAQAIDLVLAVVPSPGVIGATALERTAAGSWGLDGAITPEMAGTNLTLYTYVDGVPTGAPVTLKVAP